MKIPSREALAAQLQRVRPADGLRLPAPQVQPQVQGGQPSLTFPLSEGHSGGQCLLQSSSWVGRAFVRPAAQFDFFCPILLPPLSLSRCWSLINIWHPKLYLSFCFWKNEPATEKHLVLCRSVVSSYRRSVHNMLNSKWLYFPKDFYTPAQSCMVRLRMSERSIHFFGQVDEDLRKVMGQPHHSHFSVNVEFEHLKLVSLKPPQCTYPPWSLWTHTPVQIYCL